MSLFVKDFNVSTFHHWLVCLFLSFFPSGSPYQIENAFHFEIYTKVTHKLHLRLVGRVHLLHTALKSNWNLFDLKRAKRPINFPVINLRYNYRESTQLNCMQLWKIQCIHSMKIIHILAAPNATAIAGRSVMCAYVWRMVRGHEKNGRNPRAIKSFITVTLARCTQRTHNHHQYMWLFQSNSAAGSSLKKTN